MADRPDVISFLPITQLDKDALVALRMNFGEIERVLGILQVYENRIGKIINSRVQALGVTDEGTIYDNSVLIGNNNGIKVLDDANNLRVHLGQYAAGKYGLLLKNKAGDATILDEEGIMQTWQEGRADNVQSGFPLTLSVFLPAETRSIRKAILRFRRQAFRADATGAASGGGATSGSSSLATTVSANVSVQTGTYVLETGTGVDYTEGAGGHRHTDLNAPHDHNTGFPYYSNINSVNDHSHWLYPHGHTMIVGGHSHGMEHNHWVPDHQHGLQFGIFTSTVATGVTATINGTNRTAALGGPFIIDRSDLNIAPYLVAGQWNTIELGSSNLGRIDATVFIQALMGV